MERDVPQNNSNKMVVKSNTLVTALNTFFSNLLDEASKLDHGIETIDTYLDQKISEDKMTVEDAIELRKARAKDKNDLKLGTVASLRGVEFVPETETPRKEKLVGGKKVKNADAKEVIDVLDAADRELKESEG